MLRHHSAVELVARASTAGLVERIDDRDDLRIVRLRLTPLGHDRIAALAGAHLEELSRLRDRLDALWTELPAPP